ncbi:MAG TPA: hypothetical protein VFQ54_03085 [Thermomicrobiales bacterium]|nr:hypothetical protein [Thermomicrobiales bacterium]
MIQSLIDWYKAKNRHDRNVIGGFVIGLSFGLVFILLSPTIWYAGLIGGIILGIIMAKLFALDADHDMQEQRVSRLANPVLTQRLGTQPAGNTSTPATPADPVDHEA